MSGLAVDAVLINGTSWAAAMIMLQAYTSTKLVVVVVPPGEDHNPWLRYHAHHIFHSLEQAVEFLRRADFVGPIRALEIVG